MDPTSFRTGSNPLQELSEAKFTQLLYGIAISKVDEEQYSLFERSFCGSVRQIHITPWGVQDEWFTPLDLHGRTLLVRALQREKGDTLWSQFLAYHMPEGALLQPDRQGGTAFTYAANHRAFGTLTILLRRYPNSLFNPKGLLLSCVCQKHKDLAIQLLDRLPDAELEERDEQGKDALDWAWQHGWMDVVELLVSRLPLKRLERLDGRDLSLLERAILGKHESVALLLIHRLPPGSLQPDRLTSYNLLRGGWELPFERAIELRHRALSNSDKCRILELGIRYSGDEALRKLIEKLPQEEVLYFNTPREDDWLYLARYYRREIFLPILIQRICSSGLNEKVLASLRSAVTRGDIDLLKLLMEALQGVDLDIQLTERGETIVHLALLCECEEAALLCISHSTPLALAMQDCDGFTPLHLAVKKGMEKVVEAIASKVMPAALSLPDKQLDTPLHLAVRSGSMPIVQSLVTITPPKGLAATDSAGRSVLHLAVMEGLSREIIGSILDKMPTEGVVARDRQGHTALHRGLRAYKHIAGDLRKAANQCMGSESLDERRATCDEIGRNERAIVDELIKRVPPQLFWARDMDGMTPMDLANGSPDKTILQAMKQKLTDHELPLSIERDVDRAQQVAKEYAVGNYDLARLWSCGAKLRLREGDFHSLCQGFPAHWHHLRFGAFEARRCNITLVPKEPLVDRQALLIAHFCDPGRILSLFASPLSSDAKKLQVCRAGLLIEGKLAQMERGIRGLNRQEQEQSIYWNRKWLRSILPWGLALAWQDNKHRLLIELGWKYLSFDQHALLLPLMGERIAEFYEALPDEVKRYSADLLTADQCALLCGGALKRAEERLRDVIGTNDLVSRYREGDSKRRRKLEPKLLEAEERTTQQRRRIEGSLEEMKYFIFHGHVVKGRCIKQTERVQEGLFSCLTGLKEVAHELSSWVEEIMPPEEFMCTVGQQLMRNPIRLVVQADAGLEREAAYYEKEAAAKLTNSPLSRRPIHSHELDRELKDKIAHWREEHPGIADKI